MSGRMASLLSAVVLITGLGLYSLVQAQTHSMAIHEPHMSAAYGHLQEAKAELEKAAPNKGGHREKAMQLVDQAMSQIEAGEQYEQQHHGH